MNSSECDKNLKNYTTITVHRSPSGQVHDGLLRAGQAIVPCKLGRAGISSRKLEGDGATPAGSFAIIGGFYRKDRLGLISSRLPLVPIEENMAWCDDPGNGNYNRLVIPPPSASHEKLFREDNLYDICLILDYNYTRRTRNAGSAIFFHLSGEKQRPTEGCVAICLHAMLKLIPRMDNGTIMKILP